MAVKFQEEKRKDGARLSGLEQMRDCSLYTLSAPQWEGDEGPHSKFRITHAKLHFKYFISFPGGDYYNFTLLNSA